MYSRDRINTIRKMKIKLGLTEDDMGCHDRESMDEYMIRMSEQTSLINHLIPRGETVWDCDEPNFVIVFRKETSQYDIAADEEEKEFRGERTAYFFFKELNKYD